MLTLVTKQDLWWNERVKVQQYYEDGDYAMQIARLREAKGNQHFIHEYGYGSLCLDNLKSGNGEVVAVTTAGYDDNLRFAHQRRIFEVIEGFSK